MRGKKKIGFYLAFTFILQILLTPFQAIGATGYSASISQVTRESAITVDVGSTVEVTHTLHGPSETYESSLREIALVLDVSGSMADSIGNQSKLSLLKKRAKELVDEYDGDNVSISLIQYSNSADNPTKFYNMKVKTDVNAIKNKISNMNAKGATNIGDGMRRGYYQLLNSGNNEANKYMIVMTDGVPQGFTLNKITNNLNDYKLNDGNTGVTQNSRYDYYSNSKYFMYDGNNNIRILAETSGETQREYSASYAKKIGSMIVENGKIKPFFIGFSSNTNFGYLNEIAQATNAKVVEDDRYYYNAKSDDELTQAFNNIKAQMLDQYIFESVHYEEDIPNDVIVKTLPEGFSFDENSRKLSGNLDAAMVKNAETGKYDFVCEPFTISYEFIKNGIYTFNKATLNYKDPFNNNSRQAEVNDMNVTVIGDLYPTISIEVHDGDRKVDSSPFITDDSSPNRQEFILVNAEKLKAEEGATATINVKGKNIESSNYAFTKNRFEDNISWIDLDTTMEIVNPPDLLDTEGLKSRYYNVNHLPLLSDDAKWSKRSEVYKYPKDEIKIRSGFLDPVGSSYAQKENYLFFGFLGVDGVDYKEAAKFWGYIVPEESGEYYFAIQSDDGNYAYIIVDGQKVVISDHFKPTSPNLTYTNNKVSLKKGIAYPIYLEYFNYGGEGEFQILKKDTPWNSYTDETYKYKDNRVLQKQHQSKYRVPPSWFRATSNNAPGENPEVTFEATKSVEFPEKSGKYYIAAKVDNESGYTREAVYGPFIVDNTSPEITLNGDSTMEINPNLSFEDPGATAKDYNFETNEYIDLEVEVEIKKGEEVVEEIDTTNIGTYTIIYSAEDEFGNKATVTRTVKVVAGVKLDSHVIYIKKGETTTLTATVTPSDHDLEWSIIDSDGNINIVSLVANGSTAEITALEVGHTQVKAKDKDIATSEVFDICDIYVYEYKDENQKMIVGQKKKIIEIPTGMSIELPSPPSIIDFNTNNGEVTANSVGTETINIRVGYITPEGTFEEEDSINYTIDVFNVKFNNSLSSYGYAYPDKATFRLRFDVETPSPEKKLPESVLEVKPYFGSTIISMPDQTLKDTILMSVDLTSGSSSAVSGGITSKACTASNISIGINELLAGTYETIVTVELEPGDGLTKEIYQGYIGDMISIENILEVNGYDIPLGTTINGVDGTTQIRFENSPYIR